MPFTGIRESIERFVKLSDEEFGQFATFLKELEAPRKTILLQEGEVCRHVYFVRQGCLKYYYNVDGEERVGQFFFENSWASDLYSCLTRQPSRMNFDAVEDCFLYVMNYSDLVQIYETIPRMERFGRLMIESIFVASQQRSAALITSSPEERYLQLIRERPKVVERIPQYLIASYLGIKPESLSRIRKRIFEERKNDLNSSQ